MSSIFPRESKTPTLSALLFARVGAGTKGLNYLTCFLDGALMCSDKFIDTQGPVLELQADIRPSNAAHPDKLVHSTASKEWRIRTRKARANKTCIRTTTFLIARVALYVVFLRL